MGLECGRTGRGSPSGWLPVGLLAAERTPKRLAQRGSRTGLFLGTPKFEPHPPRVNDPRRCSGELQVRVNESLALDDPPGAHVERVLEHGTGRGDGVEFPPLPAGVH